LALGLHERSVIGPKSKKLSCCLNAQRDQEGKDEIADQKTEPTGTRVAFPRDPTATAGIGQFAVIQALAPSVGLEVAAINVRDAGEIETTIAAFARAANGGLIVTAGPGSLIHRDLIVALAARHRLPAVYFDISSPPAA
jgi:hypothetical protein